MHTQCILKFQAPEMTEFMMTIKITTTYRFSHDTTKSQMQYLPMKMKYPTTLAANARHYMFSPGANIFDLCLKQSNTGMRSTRQLQSKNFFRFLIF